MSPRTQGSDAYARFVASMGIGFEQSHDGVPYDLDALDEMSPLGRSRIEPKLIARKDQDWRDSEALARLGSAAAIKALVSSTTGPNRVVRLRAGELLHGKGVAIDLDGLVVDALRHTGIGTGLTQALDLAARYPSPAIERTLLHGARCADDDKGREVFFPALLLYLHGKTSEPFDQDHQPFFQRFHAPPGPAREQAYRELCERIGADPSQVSYTEPFPKVQAPGRQPARPIVPTVLQLVIAAAVLLAIWLLQANPH